jgi:hypothetical protein
VDGQAEKAFYAKKNSRIVPRTYGGVLFPQELAEGPAFLSRKQAIAGAADGVMVLRRARGERSMTLSLTGRDVEERSVALTADFEGMTYRLEGDAVEARATEEQRRILRVLRERGEDTSIADVAAELGRKVATTRTLLWRMARVGTITRGEREGTYRYGEKGNTLPPSSSSLSINGGKYGNGGNAGNAGNSGNAGNVPVSVSLLPPDGGGVSGRFRPSRNMETPLKPCAATVYPHSVSTVSTVSIGGHVPAETPNGGESVTQTGGGNAPAETPMETLETLAPATEEDSPSTRGAEAAPVPKREELPPPDEELLAVFGWTGRTGREGK